MSKLYCIIQLCHGGDSMNQHHRLLTIYTNFILGRSINKKDLATQWEVSDRTIQRDIDHIRNYLHESEDWRLTDYPIVYDHKQNSYYIKSENLLKNQLFDNK